MNLLASLRTSNRPLRCATLTYLFGLLILTLLPDEASAKSRLQINSAHYRGNALTVNGSFKGTELPGDGKLRLIDRTLGMAIAELNLFSLSAKRNKRRFRFAISNPYDIPCAVRVSAAGAKDKFKKVRGAPKKSCSTGKTPPVAVVPKPTPEPTPIPTPTPTPTPSLEPVCAIEDPAADAALTANTPVTFRGRLKANDPAAPSLSYEWDFAGGAMERPKGTVTGEETVEALARFVRNNSTYRVRLAAMDSAGRRCEAAVNVVVGQLPVGLPDVAPLAAASRQTLLLREARCKKERAKRSFCPSRTGPCSAVWIPAWRPTCTRSTGL